MVGIVSSAAATRAKSSAAPDIAVLAPAQGGVVRLVRALLSNATAAPPCVDAAPCGGGTCVRGRCVPPPGAAPTAAFVPAWSPALSYDAEADAWSVNATAPDAEVDPFWTERRGLAQLRSRGIVSRACRAAIGRTTWRPRCCCATQAAPRRAFSPPASSSPPPPPPPSPPRAPCCMRGSRRCERCGARCATLRCCTAFVHGCNTIDGVAVKSLFSRAASGRTPPRRCACFAAARSAAKWQRSWVGGGCRRCVAARTRAGLHGRAVSTRAVPVVAVPRSAPRPSAGRVGCAAVARRAPASARPRPAPLPTAGAFWGEAPRLAAEREWEAPLENPPAYCVRVDGA